MHRCHDEARGRDCQADLAGEPDGKSAVRNALEPSPGTRRMASMSDLVQAGGAELTEI